MGLFGDTRALKERLRYVEEDRDRLQAENRELRDALLSVTAPQVYHQRITREEEERNPEAKFKQDEIEFHSKYIRELDKPTFQNPDEFLEYLRRGAPTLQDSLEERATEPPNLGGESLHGNTES